MPLEPTAIFVPFEHLQNLIDKPLVGGAFGAAAGILLAALASRTHVEPVKSGMYVLFTGIGATSGAKAWITESPSHFFARRRMYRLNNLSEKNTEPGLAYQCVILLQHLHITIDIALRGFC